VQAATLMGDRIGRGRQVDEHVVAVEGDREAAQIVRELVEGAPGRQVEASVVPVAGQDPVADGAAVEREAHVRAAVVDRVHLLSLREEAEDVPVEVDDPTARGSQLSERAGADATG